MPNKPKTNLTAEQQAALSAHDRSVSLAAGAGCGKTFVLTERYLSYLDPCLPEPSAELSELVAITFTDAAAREMRDRIRRRSYERLQAAKNPDEQSGWKQLLSTLDGARISTIHSFCAALLRSHAAEAAVDPQFELLDPPTAQLMRMQSLDDHLRQLLVDSDERLIQLATHFGLRSLRDHVAALLSDQVEGVLARWGKATPAKLAKHWQQHYNTQVAPAALAALAEAEPVVLLRELCETADVTKAKTQTHFADLVLLLDSFPQSDTPHPSALRLREMAKVQGVCTKKDWGDEDDFGTYKETCTAVRALIDKSILRYPLAVEDLKAAAAVGLDLLKLVGEVTARYNKAKQQRNVLEYDDLLSRTHALLTDKSYPLVQQNLVRSTQLLMVDEFQDTDPQQVAIVKALRGDAWAERGLFVVGDFKQSIYRFRGAEPQVSGDLRATLPEESRLSLTTNFRSQPAVLDFVNALFHDAFVEGYEPLSAHRPQLSPTPAIEFLWAQPDAEQADSQQSESKGDQRLTGVTRRRMQEARFIARRLAQLLDDGEPLVVDTSGDEPTARPLQLGDIAVLLRTLSDVALYEEAFREYGLDYYLTGGHAFYAQQEIYDVLHLLRTVASPVDDLSLAGVLRSPMFALNDETLFWLAEQSGSLNAGLFGETLPEELSPAELAKTVRAATTLGELREQKDQLLVAELLSQAIAATGYDAILQTEFLGHRKWANVQKLIEQARTLDRTRPGDLNGFVTQLSEFVLRAPKEALAATSTEGDVIRIMTVHGSKGLEFPLVVVPDLDRPSNHGSRQPVFDEDLGPLVPSPEKQAIVGWDMHHFAEKEQDLEERKRLLYVACTRAADYLLLSSSTEDLQKPKSDWLKLLSEHFSLTTGACLTNLPDGYVAPEVCVTTSEPETDRKPAGPTHGTDLVKLIAKTHQLAEAGKGIVPAEVAPIAVSPHARKRFSFSRLSGEFEVASRESRATSSQALSGDALALGTLVHAVLERIDFAQPTTDLAGLCEFLAPQHTEEQHTEDSTQAITEEATQLVKKFLQTDRAAQLAAARDVRREVEFLLPWPLDQQPYEGRYLQGYIDCLYQDTAGDWHLLDYKTNQVTEADVPQAAEHYAMQMFVYSLACERALGVAPVESVLHFLRPASEFTFEWTAAQRAAMSEQIEQAMREEMT